MAYGEIFSILNKRTSNEQQLPSALEQLKVGESYSFGPLSGSLQLMHIELDWWNFQNSYHEITQSTLVSITRITQNRAYFVVKPQFLVETSTIRDHWVRIKLTRHVNNWELRIRSESTLSLDRLWITVLVEDPAYLLKELLSHREMLLHNSDQLQLPASIHANDTLCLEKFPASFHRIASSGPTIVTQELSLTKSEVSYLIGRNGMRVQAIREAGATIIKILPISKRLTSVQLNHPESVLQTIAITGDLFSIATTVCTIDAHLRLRRASSRYDL